MALHHELPIYQIARKAPSFREGRMSTGKLDMTEIATQDLIQALRTGPAVTLVTMEAANRLEQQGRELEDMRRRAIKTESAASQAIADINALNTKLANTERDRDWLKDCMATLERENAELRPRLTSEHIDWSKPAAEIEADYCASVRRVRELEDLDAACGRAHQALSDAGIACGRLDERVLAAADLLRWRKQSEEPAPKADIVLTRFGGPFWLDDGKRVLSDAFWRPIGPLPKPTHKEST